MPSNQFSSLGSAFKREIHKSVSGKECGLKDSVGCFIGQRKILFGRCRLLHSASAFNYLHMLIQPGALIAAKSNLPLLNRRNSTMVGSFSRSFSIPSVSGPSFQVCGFQIDRLLSEWNHTLCNIESHKTSMASCGSRSIVGDCSQNSLSSKLENLKATPNNAAAFHGSPSIDCCRKADTSLKNKEPNNNRYLSRYLIYNDVTKRGGGSVPLVGFRLKSYHSTSFASSPAVPAPNMLFDGSGHEEQVSNTTVSSEKNDIEGRILKLVSGSCYLPHPDKEETGGEDAHFICTDEQAIGVADGVGGWADVGVDSGLFSRELMSNSVAAIHEEPKGSIDPARVLKKAHSCTESRGSSTACIIALTPQGLNAINLGDSGFVVIREGHTVFRSPVQQHDFNFTFQLESGNDGDLPSSGQVFTIPVVPGDVLIAGTDGLFDNLYTNEVTGVVVHAIRAGLGPQVTAQKIAALARQRALDKNRQTPFSTAAQDAGFRYHGGKLDDITVVVSFITSICNESSSPNSASVSS